GFAMFTRHAQLAFGDPAAAGAAAPAPAPAHKKRHDAEQRDYIAAEAGRQTRSTAPLRLVHGERLPGPAVNASRAMGEIDRSWETSRPQIAVIDGLLTPEALERLRRFCWGSTIWRRVYDGGYLGAMPEHGFAAPLLAQIADEMREALPTILQDHPLNYLWAFKYDASLGGIKLHADRAAVNVNFWITPDEANLDPESGGLVVWDAAAPLDWDFERYNDDPEASRAFLAAAKARPIKTPYRSNRAVIFDSDLFHETDAIAFKPGYLNRRINVTMLFGRRSSENR
ncbi:MAG: hypothetical protein JWQ29_798, partial [Phenylobacterium sp.]|nr:hypothetical protein [Phenylobacterium sp.]